MQKNYLVPYNRSDYHDRCKEIKGDCLHFLKHCTTEIFYLYFRTCFQMNPKLFLACLLETTQVNNITFCFYFFKKKDISSPIKIMQEMAEQSSHLIHSELY